MKKSKLKKTDKIIRNKRIVFRESEGKLYILDTDNATIHTLNETAGFIWKNLANKTSIEELAIKMQKEFQVSKNESVKDIEMFVQKYLERDFILIV